MSWSATGTIDLPGSLEELDVTPAEDELDQGPKSQLNYAKDVVSSAFEGDLLKEGTYNVHLSGHSNEGEDDAGDNLSIGIHRTVR